MDFEKISNKVPNFVIELLERYIENSREANPDIERSGLDSEKAEIFKSGFAFKSSSGEVIFEGVNSKPKDHVMLGSSSKFFFFNLFAKYFPNPSDVKFNVGLNYIAELVGRDDVARTLEHMMQNLDVYGGFFKAIGLETKDLLGNRNLDSYVVDRVRERISRLLKQNPDFEIEIPFLELCYSTIHVSANIGLNILKKYLFNHWKNIEGWSDEESEAKSIEKLDRELKELDPSFEPTKSLTNFAHWKQEGANTSVAESYVAGFERVVLEVLSPNSNPAQKEILKNIENNEINFNFNLSASDKGKELKSKGWKIYEKTGSYPCVRWIPVLAKEGCPPHDVLFTVVTLIDPQGKPYSFCYYELIHVALPDELDQNGLPNEYGKNYEAYYKAVESRFYEDFRNNMWNHVEKILKPLL